DRVISRVQPGITDLRFPQHATNVVAHLIEFFLPDIIRVDFQQQIGTALQIETKHQVALRPERPGLYPGLRKEIWYRAQAHHERREYDRQRLPPCEIQH